MGELALFIEYKGCPNFLDEALNINARVCVIVYVCVCVCVITKLACSKFVVAIIFIAKLVL